MFQLHSRRKWIVRIKKSSWFWKPYFHCWTAPSKYISRIKNRQWSQVHLRSGTCSLSTLFLSSDDVVKNVRKTTTRRCDEVEWPTGNVSRQSWSHTWRSQMCTMDLIIYTWSKSIKYSCKRCLEKSMIQNGKDKMSLYFRKYKPGLEDSRSILQFLSCTEFFIFFLFAWTAAARKYNESNNHL